MNISAAAAPPEHILEKYLKRLKSLADPEAAAGMARFGINPDNTLGVSIPALRKIAKEIGKPYPCAAVLVIWHP
ncbi:MAG: DNA alkylation repair protein [Candidatus Methanoperedens sp.]|nr:DNA alkylation repair protein [Candidatus Methanoperedens sp.]